jgi:small subunit ribosomal protein S1
MRVLVVGMDRERPRISLSIKRPAGDRWERLTRTAQLGQTVEATVTRVRPYGAFAKVADGVEGLVHESGLAAGFVTDPNDVVRMGDLLQMKILAIDTERGRLSLCARIAERTSSEREALSYVLSNV